MSEAAITERTPKATGRGRNLWLLIAFNLFLACLMCALAWLERPLPRSLAAIAFAASLVQLVMGFRSVRKAPATGVPAILLALACAGFSGLILLAYAGLLSEDRSGDSCRLEDCHAELAWAVSGSSVLNTPTS